MCGRYVLPDEEAMAICWTGVLFADKGWKPGFNIAPTMPVPVLRKCDSGKLEVTTARWGLVPGWWRKENPPTLTFNARSEEAASKPVWRDSFRRMRCLMPARGWYEWNEHEPLPAPRGRTTNQPYFFHCPNTPVIAFAGLWSMWSRPGHADVLSCALLSKRAAPAIAGIHHRMPVVLKPEHQNAWLDSATPPDALPQILSDAREDLEAYPVSTRVNNIRNDSPDLLTRVPPPPPTLDLFGNPLLGCVISP